MDFKLFLKFSKLKLILVLLILILANIPYIGIINTGEKVPCNCLACVGCKCYCPTDRPSIFIPNPLLWLPLWSNTYGILTSNNLGTLLPIVFIVKNLKIPSFIYPTPFLLLPLILCYWYLLSCLGVYFYARITRKKL